VPADQVERIARETEDWFDAPAPRRARRKPRA